MASVTLSDLLTVGCDIELKFEDGTMPANSGALRLMSSVFNNALDAQHCQAPIKETKASACSAPTTASKTNIPLPGITLEQWLRIAEFLYPVVPSPNIEDWAEAEYLLEVGVSIYVLGCQAAAAACASLRGKGHCFSVWLVRPAATIACCT
jgi:hypothetical protein